MAALEMIVEGNEVLARAQFLVPDDPFADADPDEEPDAFTLTDPDTVTFTVRKHERGADTTGYVYGVAGEVSRESAGVYVWALVADDGVWHLHVQGTGACQAAMETSFEVVSSRALA